MFMAAAEEDAAGNAARPAGVELRGALLGRAGASLPRE
jgi:hypothetical protein